MPALPQKRAVVAWLPALVYVVAEHRVGWLEVEGQVAGPLILWQDPEAPKGPRWTVGTASTGLALVRVTDEALAKRAGALLLAKVPHDVLALGKAEVMDALPDWVRPWCVKLTRGDKWLEPEID